MRAADAKHKVLFKENKELTNQRNNLVSITTSAGPQPWKREPPGAPERRQLQAARRATAGRARL